MSAQNVSSIKNLIRTEDNTSWGKTDLDTTQCSDTKKILNVGKNVYVLSGKQLWNTMLKANYRNAPNPLVIDVFDSQEDLEHAIKQAPPDFVLFPSEFFQFPVFENLNNLCSEFDINYTVVSDESILRSRQTGIAVGRTIQCDLFLTGWIDEYAKARSIEPFLQAAQKRPTNERISKSTKYVLLGASTGGIDAILEILRNYPSDCPATLIVQHTRRNFGSRLISMLNANCPAKVVRARDNAQIESGIVYIAAGGPCHMTISKNREIRLCLTEGNPSSGHLSSIDALFNSAVPIARHCIAGILTGMGNDGAKGLLELRTAGARTFVQDEKSSVVYGMPRCAWDIGAAEFKVPIGKTASHIMAQCSANSSDEQRSF